MIKPGRGELSLYALRINFHFNADRFLQYYDEKNWTIGGKKITDWRAVVRHWKDNGISIRPYTKADLDAELSFNKSHVGIERFPI